MELYNRIVDPKLTVRRMYVVANHVINENSIGEEPPEQLDFYTDYESLEHQKAEEEKWLFREKNMQKALIGIKKKYGKNAVLKGMNLEEGATTIERNGQVGGHRA